MKIKTVASIIASGTIGSFGQRCRRNITMISPVKIDITMRRRIRLGGRAGMASSAHSSSLRQIEFANVLLSEVSGASFSAQCNCESFLIIVDHSGGVYQRNISEIVGKSEINQKKVFEVGLIFFDLLSFSNNPDKLYI